MIAYQLAESGNLLGHKFAMLTWLQFFECESTNADANKPERRVTNRCSHFANLPISPLMDNDACAALATHLAPHAFLLMPNLHEAAALAGFPVHDPDSMRRAAEKLAGLGAAHVLIKGGHLQGDALDILYTPGQGFREFSAARIGTPHTHGTGCTYSAAITACLAKGVGLDEAVGRAKVFLTEAIRTNPGLGGGSGPLNHHA